MRTFKSLSGFLAGLCLVAASQAGAQTVTTGTISGIVSDAQGGVLPGATVTALHIPTGTRYEAVTEAAGQFTMLNVRAGGPYTIAVSMSGFRDESLSDVQVALGEDKKVTFTMQLASVTETVEVTGQASPIDVSRAGTASNVPAQAIETLPTVQRSLFDFARLSPHFVPTALNESPLSVSVAGQNNRYNNISIDGAVNNDLFGLAESGTPGGQTESQPVSIDAIQELQLVVSAYDVRQGGFAGGGINAITKSGTNGFRGTGYYFGRNQKLVGESPEGRQVADFSDKQFGASVGGPVVKNRAFFFGNFDLGRKNQPSGWSISGSGQQWGHDSEVARFVSILKNKYGYDPGSTDEFIRTTNNDKVFVRTDFNIGLNQLTLRHNYVNGVNDIGRPSSSRFIFPDNFYQFKDITNSTVAQLNSTIGARSFNELRFTYQRVRDKRNGPTAFPQVDVRTADNNFLRVGREQFSTANELDQDILEFTDDFTTVRGAHTLVVGTHNEFFKFRNLFIRDNFGTYVFQSLDLFDQGLAQGYDYSFSMTGNATQAARFKVRQFGAYVGDRWRPNSHLTATLGLRVDTPRFPDNPTANPDAAALFGYATDVVPTNVQWSPRLGINWDVSGDGTRQVRGGIGLFSGRTPYVWLSNQYGNTGIEFRRLRVTENASQRIPFSPDPARQPTNIGSASTNEIDLVDPDYKFPQLLRGNVGYDRTVTIAGESLILSAELLFSKTRKDIKYQNLNLTQTTTRPDGRPVYAFGTRAYSDVIFLTNTTEGSQWSTVLKLEKPWRSGWYASASYLYGEAKSIMDGTSSQAASNWGNVYVPGDPNNPPLTRSNFDPGHRITLAASYDVRFPKGVKSTVSVYYSGQSGRPYSLNYSSDYNGDGRTTNDLLFIPRSADEVVFQGGTFDQFMTFINSRECYSKYIGRIVERNACRAPWINTIDFRVAVGVPMPGTAKVELTADVLNIGNLFDRNAGLLRYANFNDILVARFAGLQGTKPIYNIANLVAPTFTEYNRDDLKSRWQGQFGVRVRF